MNQTAYSCVSTTDLIIYAIARDNRTDMELELAQRLMLACQMIEEEQERVVRYDSGRTLKAAS